MNYSITLFWHSLYIRLYILNYIQYFLVTKKQSKCTHCLLKLNFLLNTQRIYYIGQLISYYFTNLVLLKRLSSVGLRILVCRLSLLYFNYYIFLLVNCLRYLLYKANVYYTQIDYSFIYVFQGTQVKPRTLIFS